MNEQFNASLKMNMHILTNQYRNLAIHVECGGYS